MRLTYLTATMTMMMMMIIEVIKITEMIALTSKIVPIVASVNNLAMMAN